MQIPSHVFIFVQTPPFDIKRVRFLPMKIILLAVGKTDVSWVRQGTELYCSRLSHYAPFEMKELPSLKNTSSMSKEQIKDKEGSLILDNIKDADEVLLLDEGGKEFSSVGFASYIQDKMLRGGKNLVFVIGGAYGFSEEVYKRADGKVSLSKMTFSHQMVRAVFTEQLYRAFTIMKGEPYHHE